MLESQSSRAAKLEESSKTMQVAYKYGLKIWFAVGGMLGRIRQEHSNKKQLST